MNEKNKTEALDIKEFLKAGVQFGHEKTRWNPKMQKYIFGERNNIHIIDLQKTLPLLAEACEKLTELSKSGPVLFVGTKRQARELIKKYANEAGSYYINYRWLGGLLTNFKMIKKSLQKLNNLEQEMEEGVANRTKYEINQMKKEWERMNRIYAGVKTMDRYPQAIVLVDCNYEKGAAEEARVAGIPVISIVDTNSDPDLVDYVIPANDDAIKSLDLILSKLANAIKAGNSLKWVKHIEKDFSNYDVKMIKRIEKVEEKEIKQDIPSTPKENVRRVSRSTSKSKKGILEIVKEQAEKEKTKEIKKTVKKEEKKTATKKVSAKKKAVKKTVSKKVAKKDTKKKVVKKTVKKPAEVKKTKNKTVKKSSK